VISFCQKKYNIINHAAVFLDIDSFSAMQLYTCRCCCGYITLFVTGTLGDPASYKYHFIS